MTTNILRASLTASPITVEAVGRSWVIPAKPASVWISALHSNNCPWSIFPGMLRGDNLADALDALTDPSTDSFDWRLAGFNAIRQAAGRPWWEALRLVAACDDNTGSLVGKLTVSGVDPDSIPFARWCAAVYSVMTDGADPKELLKFNMKLQVPPNIPEAFDQSEDDDFASMVEMARNMPGMSR